MRDSDIEAVLDRLVRVPDDEIGDWNDVLTRSGVPAGSSERQHRRRPSTRRALVLLAPVAVVALIALTVTSPWKGGPTILERAAAAVPTPTASQILYESIAVHFGTSPTSSHSARLQIWLAGSAPRSFRVVLDGPALATPVDTGARIGSTEGLNYSKTFGVLDPVPFQAPVAEAELNPAAFIRAAVAAGRARIDGRSTIAGRQVIRIVVPSRLSGDTVGSTRYFVDAHTYEPGRVVVTADVPNGAALGFPMASLVSLPFGEFPSPSRPYVLVFDFTRFRYLAPTAANRGLTDIRAQHPGAEVA